MLRNPGTILTRHTRSVAKWNKLIGDKIMPAKKVPFWLSGDPPLMDELRRQLKIGGPGVTNGLEVPVESLEHVLKALESGHTVHAAAETAILAGFMRPCVAYGQNTQSGVWR